MLAGEPSRLRLQGEVENGVWRYRFAVGAEDSAKRLEPRAEARP
jgi:hypothetical protein